MRTEWMNPDNLSFNSEADQVLFCRHKKAYDNVIHFIENKKVLELGCGSGFGANILSKYTKNLSAVDRDEKALERAKAANETVDFYNADILDGLPFEKNSFDAIIAFQIFEHIHPDNSLQFLKEINRILKTGGHLYLTTPNRKIRLLPFQKPTNKYHKIEYTAKSLSKVLSNVFSEIDITGLRALPEIEKIEIKRAKGSPFSVYIRNPFRKLIVKIFGLALNKNILKTKGDVINKVPEKENSKKFSEDDFYFTRENLDKSIDFFVICKK